MKKYTLITILIAIGTILLLIAGLSLCQYAQDNSKVKIGNCYDEHNNIIIGAQCEIRETDINFLFTGILFLVPSSFGIILTIYRVLNI